MWKARTDSISSIVDVNEQAQYASTLGGSQRFVLPYAHESVSAEPNIVTSAALTPAAIAAPTAAAATDAIVAPLSLVEASAVAVDAMKSGALQHFDMQLAALYYAQSGQATKMSAFTESVEQFATAFTSDGQYVLIDTTAANRDGAGLLAELQAIGLKNGSSFGAVASGWLPVSSVAQLAATSNLASARESAFTTHTGSVTTQADHAQQADTARSMYSITGSGVRVGVLSDSFNRTGSTTDNLSTNINTDDLPASTRILHDVSGTGTDEGRAMGQLIHDLAPGSGIDFATAFNGQAAFANYILELAAAGDKVIVDDVSYYAELDYQNGIISQAVNQVAAQGVSYFSSAGNDGLEGYQGAWSAGAQQTLNGKTYTLMNFAPGQDYINVTLGSREVFILQWDNPGASAGGVGATSDLDLFLVNADGTTIRGSSVSSNIGGDPVELFSFTGSAGSALQLRVGLAAGSVAPREIRLIASGNGAAVDLANPASNTNLSTLSGHHGASGAMATAAVSFARTPVAGFNPPTAESFTSRGGQKITYDDNGNRLAAPIFNNVAFTAVDGGNTTFFSSDSTQDTDTLPNFFGTSAAAPDAAAVAALLLQLDPTLTPADIRALLQDSAIDMDDTATSGFDYGYDSRTGTGLIQADRAAGFVVNSTIINGTQTTLAGTHRAEIIVGSGGNDTIYGMGGNDNIVAGDGADTVYGGSGDDVIVGNQGNDILYGEDGNDGLTGGQGNDILYGGAGDDSIEGGLGDDVINGGTGSNTVAFVYATGGVTVNLDAGTASGAAGNDRLYSIQNFVGTPYADVATGNAENNVLSGGAGSDELHGSDGDDVIDGGGGAETQYNQTLDRPDITKPQGTTNNSIATAIALTDSNYDLQFNYEIENSRSVPHATINATAAGNGFEYYAVTAAAGATAVFDIDHSLIDTVITLLNSSGTVLAQNDDDYSDPGSEIYNSRISYTFATAGTYYLRVEDFNSASTLTAGNTYQLNVSLSSAAVAFTGSQIAGFDIIDGGAGTDTANYTSATSAVNVSLLVQNATQNTGGGNTDYLISIENLVGSAYDDTLIGDNNANVLTGGAGIDTLTGNGGNDTLQGNAGNDTLDGGAGNDTLFGGADVDTINGGADNDIIIGGLGGDTLSGGANVDIFRYLAASDSTVAARDTILDFVSGTDKIDLTAVHTSPSDTFTILHLQNSTTYDVAVDLGGDGTFDMAIRSNTPVTTSDILWTSGGAAVDSDAADAQVVSQQVSIDAEQDDALVYGVHALGHMGYVTHAISEQYSIV